MSDPKQSDYESLVAEYRAMLSKTRQHHARKAAAIWTQIEAIKNRHGGKAPAFKPTTLTPKDEGKE